MLFKHSNKDLLLVLICLSNISLLVAAGIYFQSMSLTLSIICGLFLVGFYCTNYQCVSHNFIHNNFFKSKKLNFIFSIINSMAMGLPQTLYYHHHMNHHRYTNGEKDISSLFLFSKDKEREEGILSYSFIGFFRIDLLALAKRAKKKEDKVLLVSEMVGVIAFWGFLMALDWKFFCFFYLPIWYLGQVAALMENYFEHYGTKPGDRKTDSVSCYNKIYNFLWFNNGYHQEHHYAPTVHWTKISEVKEKLPGEDQRRIVKVAHFTNIPGLRS
jgi:fatty acid desaturase